MLPGLRRRGRVIPSGSARTIAGCSAFRRTTPVRQASHRRRGIFAASILAGTLMAAVDAAGADAGELGRQERRQAQGWLQLKQDQRTFRDSVEPLTPRQAGRLDRLELRQQGRARQLQQRQRRSLNSERNFRRGIPGKRPLSRSRGLKEQRQLDRQRLEMRILRRTLGPGSR